MQLDNFLFPSLFGHVRPPRDRGASLGPSLCVARGGGLVHLAAIATLASAVFALIAPPAHAGHYAVTYAADGAAILDPPNSQMQTTYTLTSSGFGVSVETSGSSASATANSAITATFNWTPDNASDTSLPPQEVLVAETSTVNASASVSPGSAGGSVDDGLGQSDTPTGPRPTNFQAGPTTLYQYSQSCTGTRYTVHTGSGFTVTCTPSAIASCGFSSAQVSVSYSATPTPVTLNLNGTTQDSDGSLNILIGQGCSAGVAADGYSFSNYQWSIPGHIFGSFDMAPDQSWGHETPVASSVLASGNPIWFWKKSSDGSVTVTCTAEAYAGNTDIGAVTVSNNITVWAPYHNTTDYETATSSFSPGNNPNAATDLTSGSPAMDPGYQFVAYVGTPALFTGGGTGPGGGYGQFFFVQLINVSRIKYGAGLANPTVATGGFWLDNGWPYSDATPASSTASVATFSLFSDTPETSILGCNSVSVGDMFKTYLMYQPPDFGYGTQPVTLERADWHWTAACSRSVIDIFGDFGPWSPSPPGATGSDGSAWDFEHPSWDNVYTNN